MTNRFFTPITQFLDDAGEPLAGGKVNFYLTGTATRADTFSDVTLLDENANPVVLDSAGRTGNIFLDPSVTYRVVLTDADDVTIWTADYVVDPSANVTAAIAVYPGDPNGNVAGNAGSVGGIGASMVYDSVNEVIYVCSVTGSASTAVWLSQTSGSAGLGSANVFTVGQTIRFTDAGASIGPMLTFDWESSTPAANDIAKIIRLYGEDSAGNDEEYGNVAFRILDPTSTSEDAAILFGVVTAGTLAYELVIDGSAIYPETNLSLDLGKAAQRFNVAHLTSIELGHATDTTITRASAGMIAVEGVTIEPGASRASFRANKNGTSQSGFSTTPVKVTFGTEEYDVGAAFATNTWTPPAGTVFVSAGILTTATMTAGSLLLIELRKNGTTIAFVQAPTNASSIASAHLSTTTTSNGTDTFDVYAYSDSDASFTVSGDPTVTHFSGVMV